MTINEVQIITNKKILKDIITNVILSYNFGHNSKYRVDYYEKNGHIGILQLILDQWIWSWLNTINTNYSCINLLINYFNNKFQEKLTFDLYKTNLNKFKKLFENYFINSRDKILNPNSFIFNELFYITQFTWNYGVISMLSTIFTLHANQKNKSTRYQFNLYRGNILDMDKGIDFIVLSDKIYGVQHKSHKLSKPKIDGDYFWFNLYYSEHYRNNVKYISIDDGEYIYFFRCSPISNDPECRQINNKFRIHKKFKIKIMKIENIEITNALIEINKICYNKRIPFHFLIKEGVTTNYIGFEDDYGEKIVRCTLIEYDDPNLLNILTEFLSELKSID